MSKKVYIVKLFQNLEDPTAKGCYQWLEAHLDGKWQGSYIKSHEAASSDPGGSFLISEQEVEAVSPYSAMLEVRG